MITYYILAFYLDVISLITCIPAQLANWSNHTSWQKPPSPCRYFQNLSKGTIDTSPPNELCNSNLQYKVSLYWNYYYITLWVIKFYILLWKYMINLNSSLYLEINTNARVVQNTFHAPTVIYPPWTCSQSLCSCFRLLRTSSKPLHPTWARADNTTFKNPNTNALTRKNVIRNKELYRLFMTNGISARI